MNRTHKANDFTAIVSEENQSLKKELSIKNILLSLTKEIPQVKAKKELMHLVKERFQNLFHFYHCSIGVVSDDKKTYKFIFLDPESKLKGHKDYQELITKKNIVEDGVFNKVLQSQLPVIIDVDRICALPNPPFYAQIVQESGLNEILALALVYEGEPIGVLSFLAEKKGSFSPDFFPLIQGIADQVSLTVKNTLINDDLEKKLLESDFMLALNNAIANIKVRSELQAAITDILKDLFHFSFSILLHLDNEKS